MKSFLTNAFKAGLSPKSVALANGCFVLLIAVVVFIGWQFDVASFKSILPGFISMKINTAIGLFLFGTSVALLAFKPERTLKVQIAAAVPIVLAATLMMATLLQYISELNFGIDELFFADHDLLREFVSSSV